MNLTIDINIKAPELSQAILSAAEALATLKLLQSIPVAPTTELVELPEVKAAEDKPADLAPVETKPEPQPEPEQPQEEPAQEAPEEAQPVVTLEQVRRKMAALSQAGKQAQLKKLLADFGVAKLSEVPAEKYGELLAAAEAIG